MTFAGKLIIFIIAALICLTTLAYGTVHQTVLGIFYFFISLMAILWALDAFLSGELRFNTSALQIPFIAAIGLGLFQIIPYGSMPETDGIGDIPKTISMDAFQTKLTISHFIALLIYFSAALAFIDSKKRIRKIVITITIFGFLYAFYAILQSFLSPNKIYGILEVQFAQPFGSFVNRHNFAALIEMAIALPFGLLLTGGIAKDKRLLYITAIGLMGVALLLSGSRGGFISLSAMIFLALFITTQTKSYGSLMLKAGLAIGLIAVLIAGASLIGGESSLTRIAETAASKDITTNRAHIWGVTTQVIKSNPLFGSGMGAFAVAYTPHDPLNGLERVEQAHNDYLQVLADGGIIGGLIGLFFLILLIRSGLKGARIADNYRRGVAIGALSGCFAVLIHSIFDFVLHTTAISVMFLTLLSLLIVSGKGKGDDSPPEKKRKRKANVTPIEEGRKKTEKIDLT